jgi:hypothetical protein
MQNWVQNNRNVNQLSIHEQLTGPHTVYVPRSARRTNASRTSKGYSRTRLSFGHPRVTVARQSDWAIFEESRESRVRRTGDCNPWMSKMDKRDCRLTRFLISGPAPTLSRFYFARMS